MGRAITNIYKFLCFLHCGGLALPADRIEQAVCNDFINDQKDFSEVSSLFLLHLKNRICKRRKYTVDGIKSKMFTYGLEDSVRKTVMKLLPIVDADRKALNEQIGAYRKIAGVRSCDADEVEYQMYCEMCIKNNFPNDSVLSGYYNEFKKDIYDELNERKSSAEKELAKYGVVLHVDLKEEELVDPQSVKRALKKGLAKKWGMKIKDSDFKDAKSLRKAVTAFLKDKLSKATTIEELDRLCATYVLVEGSDLINGFLRGDLSFDSSSKSPKEASSWGSSLRVDLPLFLDVAQQALKFKYTLYGKALEPKTVYRGLTVKRFKLSLDNQFNNKEKLDAFCKALDEVPRNAKKLEKSLPLIYMSKYITSTSSELNLAGGHVGKAERDTNGEGAVFMRILIKKGTAFGKDFSETSFKESDPNKEIILKPKQKICIKGIQIHASGVVIVDGDTIA